jgi:hypothetical protein
MPYQGKLIGLLEMLDVLTSQKRTEAEAVLELERAIEDKAIDLRLPDGTNAGGETLYCEMSRAGRSEVVAMLRDFPNWMRIPTMRNWNTPIAMFKAARAIRMQFEVACGLRVGEEEASPRLGRRFVSDEQLVAEALEGIRTGRWPNAHRAAQDLEERADGASPEAKVRRLGGKIRDAMN